MARSDFNWVGIHHNFTAANPTVTKHFPIEGNLSPKDTAYLIMQVQGVSFQNHKILINGKELDGSDILTDSTGWQTWMDGIPSGSLKKGDNTITITRAANDDFRVGGVVVNWRE